MFIIFSKLGIFVEGDFRCFLIRPEEVRAMVSTGCSITEELRCSEALSQFQT